MNRESIIARIKKCMALSQSSNANEAAAALKKAQELMVKHSVSHMDVAISDVGDASGILCKAQTPPQYLVNLAHCAADAFGCRFLVVKSWFRDPTTIQFIGIKPQPEIAAYVFDVLRRSIAKGRQEYLKQIPKQTKARNKTKRADMWAMGWVTGVEAHVQKMAMPDESKAAINEWVDRECNVTEGKARNTTETCKNAAGDYYSGLAEGRKQRLHRPIDGTGTGPARISA